MNNELLTKQILRKYFDKSKHNYISLEPAQVSDDCTDGDLNRINRELADKGLIDINVYNDESTGIEIMSGKITKLGIEKMSKEFRF